VFSGPRVRIGRSRDNDVILVDSDGPQSSGHHAEAVVESGRWWIRDLESTNGTFVNGVRVVRARLRSGDSLAFGEDHFSVETNRSILVASGAAGVIVAAAISTYALLGRSATDLEKSAAVVARSVYLVAFEEPAGRRPLGTAFAVRADGLLATNAHVADVLRQRRAASLGGGRAIVIRSDSDEVREVLQVQLNPRWRVGSIADDVALLRVGGSDPVVPLQLGDAAAVAALSRGTQLASVGFPADEVDAKRPRGRLTVDVLGDIRDQRYLAVGLEIAPGTSGSPIFRSDGVVVGLVAGGKFVSGPDGKPESTKINWGISVVALRELLTQLSARGPRHTDFAWWGGSYGTRFFQNCCTRSTASAAATRAFSAIRSRPTPASAVNVLDAGIGTSWLNRVDSAEMSME
jgi:V8-like Glu-specific endopeptidase